MCIYCFWGNKYFSDNSGYYIGIWISMLWLFGKLLQFPNFDILFFRGNPTNFYKFFIRYMLKIIVSFFNILIFAGLSDRIPLLNFQRDKEEEEVLLIFVQIFPWIYTFFLSICFFGFYKSHFWVLMSTK